MGSASAAHENRERVGARTTGRAARGRWGRAARWAGWRAARRAPSRGSAPLPRAGRAASGAARVGGKAGRACKHQGQPRWLDRFLRLDFLLSPRRPRQRHRTDTEAHTRTLAMLGGPGEPSLIVTVRHRATTGPPEQPEGPPVRLYTVTLYIYIVDVKGHRRRVGGTARVCTKGQHPCHDRALAHCTVLE